VDEIPLEALLAALNESDIMATLGITSEDLELAHGDTDLLATLQITYEFLLVLKESSVLDTFYKLPRQDQAHFLRWIGATDDSELRRKRTETLVSAIEASPLGGSAKSHRGDRSNKL
jgi:hypothetical protein